MTQASLTTLLNRDIPNNRLNTELNAQPGGAFTGGERRKFMKEKPWWQTHKSKTLLEFLPMEGQVD